MYHGKDRVYWLRCERCGQSIQNTERLYHNRYEHVPRPDPEAMTTAEVAKVLKCTVGTVRARIGKGKLKAVTHSQGRGKRVFVARADLLKYVRELTKDPERLVKWAQTGRLDV